MGKEEGSVDPKVGQGGNGSPEITVELDGGEKKTMRAEDVKNLLAQQASATQKAQQAAALIDAAKKYSLEPEDYVGHAEGAFAAMTRLMELGLVDDKGNPIERKEEPKPANSPALPSQSVSPKVGEDTQRLINEALGKLDQRLKGLEEDQTRIMRMNLSKEIRSKHQNLSEDDVSRILGTAMNDPRKSVWQHAEEAALAKVAGENEAEKKFAEKYGINLEEWNANKIKEQNSEGGAAAIVGGRKISFKKGEGKVTPKQAMAEFLAKQSKQR